MNAKKTKGLGMGLTALLGPDAYNTELRVDSEMPHKGVQTLPTSALQAGKYQPRTRMDEQSLQELAASIRQHGIMQPIVVRALGSGSNPSEYEIIAGERRFRAASLAGLTEVPVIVRQLSDQDALALALIENIQREDLSALEQALAIKRLIEEFHFTHEEAADVLGRSRSATSNLLRLLQLAAPVQTMLSAGDIDMGHARALLALPNAEQIMLATQIHAKRLSVREAEKLVTQQLQASVRPGNAKAAPRKTVDADILRLQERLADALGTTVKLTPKGKAGGELSIAFHDHESLQALLERLQLAELLDA